MKIFPNHILVTGAAGFIGYHVSQALLAKGCHVVGVDNLNAYYDVSLKNARLAQLQLHPSFYFYRLDIADRTAMQGMWMQHPEIDHIIHLAAQAGVRYSLEDPFAYTHSNITGHLVLLELARHREAIKHFVYASSSSVYGSNTKLPFSVQDRCDTPISLYAATKKANELMTQAYHHLFAIPSTGLRFFTVYGPWGRPDMAAYIFANRIVANQPLQVYNYGEMKRDFTYIDDICEGVLAALINPPAIDEDGSAHRVYNLGNHRSEPLMKFIRLLEDALGRKAIIEFLPLQPGDVPETFAEIADTQRDLGFEPKTPIETGIQNFAAWYKDYYKLEAA